MCKKKKKKRTQLKPNKVEENSETEQVAREPLQSVTNDSRTEQEYYCREKPIQNKNIMAVRSPYRTPKILML
jgi:hypothetical protein